MNSKSNKYGSDASGSPEVSESIPHVKSKLKNDLFGDMCIAWLAINLIDGAPRRVRRALEKQIDAVVKAVKAFGFRVPILVRQTPDGNRYEVVDGHIRLEAANRLGAEQVPCIVVDDLSEVDLRRLTLSLNKLQETGQWDDEAVALEINDILEIDGSFEFPGFELAEIEAIRFGAGDPEESDPADDLSEHEAGHSELVTRPGDVWLLGDHRIQCGNARDGDGLARW